MDCKEYNVIGFDCGWLTVGGLLRPVALIQFATHKGFCALIRLCHLKRIPPELREILDDNNIINLGIPPHDDAASQHARITLLYSSLANLSSSVLNVELDKDWHIRCLDWEALTLNE